MAYSNDKWLKDFGDSTNMHEPINPQSLKRSTGKKISKDNYPKPLISNARGSGSMPGRDDD